MHDTHHLLEARARRTLVERIRPHDHEVVADLTVAAWDVTDPEGVPGQGEPVPFARAREAGYRPFPIGGEWGPSWGTTWFRMSCDIPADAPRPLELLIDLGWEDHSPGFQSEGLVYTPDGRVIKAINPRNQWVGVPDDATGTFTVYVEAAANPLLLGVPPFQVTPDGDKVTACTDPIYRLAKAQLISVNEDVRALGFDVEILSELALTMPEGSQERLRLTLAVNDALDALDLDDVVGSAPQVRERLAPALSRPALPGAHRLTAVGHAHIDSAWLWPLRETRRKVTRTIANVLRLLDDGADMVFALPAAQHVAWLEEDAPDVFARLQEWVKKGRIVPVGGMWVEPDAQLPGGESLCRQLLYGQRYFERALGTRCRGIWLPDSFGYSPALPQIGTLGGAEWFLTQKISWNQTDVFPHHTLRWEGIDGTRIFTHFPPVDTYGAEITPHQVNHAATNFKDKGRASVSLLPYGYGDGGGGPTRDMLERASRLADLEGAPRLEHDTPDHFFAQAKADYPEPPVWVGELYLELHRGTSTTQARTKLGNREAEAALREAELWAATAATAGLVEYPYDRFEALWRDTLLAQFHDILPGTSIAWVYRDVEAMHANVIAEARRITADACQALADRAGCALDFNAGPYEVDGVPALGAGQATREGDAVTLTREGDAFTLTNGLVSVQIDASGAVTRLVGPDGRNAVAPGGRLGELWIYQDFPNMWDAWDVDEFHLATGRPLAATAVDALSDGVRVTWEFSRSRATIDYTLAPGGTGLDVRVDVDWHEKEKLLKCRLPIDVHTDHATYETQMGHHTRPIHDNTTWESNKFEVCSHRWVHVGEPGWGVGIANSGTYGWSHERAERPGGGTFAVISASLLRAPVYPDPHTDEGVHVRRFSVVPGADLEATRQAAYRLDLPVRRMSAGAPAEGDAAGGDPVTPLVAEVSGLVIEAVKLAEDRSGDVIIRGYEPDGTRRRAHVRLGSAPREVTACDLLEGTDAPAELPTLEVDGADVTCEVHPFQIVTLRVRP